MTCVAGENSQQETDLEQRIGRPAVEIHTGQMGVQQGKDRGVPADRINECGYGGEREEAHLAIPEPPGDSADDEQEGRHRAQIEDSHVLGDVEPAVAPDETRRSPIVLHAAGSAEDVRRKERDGERRVERAAARTLEIDGRSVGLPGNNGGQQQGQGHDDDARESSAR